MKRALLFCSVLVMALFGCKTQKMICPAYQSAFLFDKPSAREAFVHYNESESQPRELLASNSKTLTLPARDSSWSKSVVLPGPALPKEKRNKRTRYLLLPEKTYRKALRALQTVEMRPVYPKKTDSVDVKKALDSAARSINDTLTSTAKTGTGGSGEEEGPYVITKEKEKYNFDQDYYMWVFRDMLVLPDVRLAMEGAKEDAKAAKNAKKKGFFGFFSNLFGKKKDAKTEPVEPAKDVDDPAAPSDSAGAEAPTAKPKKKKGLMGMFKKKPKETEASDPAARKKEDEVEDF